MSNLGSELVTLQLVRVYKFLNANLGATNSCDLLALAVEKAFDAVWHNGILSKLIMNNYPKYIVKVIHSFLSDRSFVVRVGEDHSNRVYFNFGVPQGSVLSPILYNIFTYDIPKHNLSEFALFADDTGICTLSRRYRSGQLKRV